MSWSIVHNADLEHRAMAAYWRGADPSTTDQPSRPEVWKHEDGKMYVVLPGGRASGPCAVYRVRNDGMLKRLKRWPAELNEG